MASTVAVNASWLALARLGSQALMVIFTGIVARRLGAAGLGVYSLLASVLMIANTLTTFGTDTVLIRGFAAARDWSLLTTALAVQLGLSLVLVLAALTGIRSLTALPTQTQDAGRVFALALIPLAFYGVLTAALRSFERMGMFMLLNIAGALLQAIGVVVALRVSATILSLAYLVLATYTVSAVLAALACRFAIPGFRMPLRFSKGNLTSVLQATWGLALLGLLTMVYQRQAVIMLAFVGGSAATGWFSAAAKVVDASKIAHNSLSGAMLPPLGKAAHPASNPEASEISRMTFVASWKGLFILSVIAVGAITVLAEPLTRLVFGDGFGSTATSLRVLAWALIPFTLNSYFSLAHIARGHELPVLSALGAGILTLALLNALWIPRWGGLGASWATVAAECAQSAFYLGYRRRARGPARLTQSRGEA